MTTPQEQDMLDFEAARLAYRGVTDCRKKQNSLGVLFYIDSFTDTLYNGWLLHKQHARPQIDALNEKVAVLTHNVLCATEERDQCTKEKAALCINIDVLKARVAQLNSELRKWERPFDQATFDGIKKQASHGDSLAAQRVYITALEHALKHRDTADSGVGKNQAKHKPKSTACEGIATRRIKLC